MIQGISPLVIFLIVCFLIKKFLVGFFIILPFVSIRRYSGGYHAPSPKQCFILSTSLLFLLLILSQYNIPIGVLIIFLCISLIIFIIHAPILNINRLYSIKEKRIYKKRTIIICTCWYIFFAILLLIKQRPLFMASALSIILSAMSIIPCIKKGS